MQRLGLTHSELRAYHRTLVTPGHRRRISVDVLDLDGNLLSSIRDAHVLDGQVMVDVTQTPSRILDLSFLDPSRSIHFEPDDPGDTPLHRSRMLRVTDARYVVELEEWIEAEVFTGIIWDFDRDGAVVTITGHGKERQALGQVWTAHTYGKKQPKTDVIKALMAETGELCPAIADLRPTLPERLTVTRMDSAWPRARKVADSMDRQLFYNGSGLLLLRRPPGRPLFTFDHRHLLTEVVIDRDPEGTFNTFEAVGAKPKGSKRRVRAVEKLPGRHPLSPKALARNDAPHYLVKREENRQIKTKAEARARAERMRDDASRVLVTYSFDAIPVPHLDENDLVRVVCDEGTLHLRMQRWSLPLGVEGAPPMTVGDVRRTTKVG